MKITLLLMASFFMVQNTFGQMSGPAKIEIIKTGEKYSLLKDGQPYLIKGAGCEFGRIELLAKHGANTFRTWRVDNGRNTGQEILDKALANGLMVLMGLEIKPERHGIDYNDSAAVANQKRHLLEHVEKYKNHPALLGWAAGNELNLGGKNPKVWDAVNEIAMAIHKIDPNHPVTTTLAGINKGVIDEIKVRCPNIDFISIQMYGDIINLQKRIADAGWTGPYMVTEWGATGHWEVGKTSWNAPIEQTSSEKAKAFLLRYEKAIQADTLRCLGSFVFLWGQKQERTPTWYGMFTHNGEEIETVESMHFIWNGKYPQDRCPQIDSMNINGKHAHDNIYVQPGEPMKCNIVAKDPDGDKLAYTFEIMKESTDLKMGGDRESVPEVVFSKVVDNGNLDINAPLEEGAYRLFYYVKDGKNHCGTANIPFYVKKM